mmetsp:Transcript_50997/g.45801  ORF Transcript_50997/g.45801 Transcript_50997/m.45801 type:complete len:530 (-) Transcript_50997:37-1626(-)
MSGKLTKAELKRLEELKLKLDLQQKKLKTQKSKIEKEKKSLESEKKKITQKWKELDRAKKKFEDQKEVQAKQSLSSNMKSQGKKSNNSNKKLQDQFFEMKKKYDSESKKSRDYKKKLDQLQAENKVLRNKLKNLSGRKKGRGDDKRLRQLIRENRELRKRLRKLMKELNKRRRWYKRAIKIFKNNQDKWIKAQRNAFKDKKFIIKYVFLDDVKYIKQYQKPRKGRDKIQFKNRIRVKTKGGGETTIKNVEIIVLDGDDNDDNDNTSRDNDDDDDDNNSLEAQIVYLRQEMDERANDLEKLKDILSSSEKYPDPNSEIDKLINDTINDRQNEMISSLKDLNCDTTPIKESNDEWKKYILNLSKSIAGNTKQFNYLLNIINDGFLKELNGRIKDLINVNNIYYDEDDQDIIFDKLQEIVNQRHEEIETEINTKQKEQDIDKEERDKELDENKFDADDGDSNDNDNYSKIKQLYGGLLSTNIDWNKLIKTSTTMYDESQTSKNNLINELLSKYSNLQQLINKVDKLPSTVLF